MFRFRSKDERLDDDDNNDDDVDDDEYDDVDDGDAENDGDKDDITTDVDSLSDDFDKGTFESLFLSQEAELFAVGPDARQFGKAIWEGEVESMGEGVVVVGGDEF